MIRESMKTVFPETCKPFYSIACSFFPMLNKKLLDRAEQSMIAVDSNGKPTGEIVKRAVAHSSPGVKHLAFLVFVINDKNEFVLHKRQSTKIGGNTIDSPVSHVLNGETLEQAVQRCLKNEYCIKQKLLLLNLGGFSYEKDYGDGTCENEYCLVLVVEYTGKILPNPKEIEGKPIFLPVKKAIVDARENPKKYSVWFGPAIEIFSNHPKAERFII